MKGGEEGTRDLTSSSTSSLVMQIGRRRKGKDVLSSPPLEKKGRGNNRLKPETFSPEIQIRGKEINSFWKGVGRRKGQAP